MNYGNLLYDVPPALRDLIRNLEKESKKLIRAEWSQKFNISCLTLRLPWGQIDPNPDFNSKYLFNAFSYGFDIL